MGINIIYYIFFDIKRSIKTEGRIPDAISIINVLRVNSHQAKAKAKLFFDVCQFFSMFFTFVFQFPRCKWTHLMGVKEILLCCSH